MNKQIEYIKCTGNQYLDTNFIPNGSTSLEIDCIIDSSASGNQPILGARSAANATDATSFTIWGISSSTIRIDHYGSSKTLPSTYTPKVRHKYKLSPTDFFVDDVSVSTHPESSNQSPCNLTISSVNTKGSITYGKYIIYSVKIWDDSTLIRDYVPWVDSSGVYCFKNLVDNTLSYSASETPFSGQPVPIEMKNLKSGDVLDFPYIGSTKVVILPKGIYKLETWGAQGGYRSSSSNGGKGGYSVGTVTLNEKTILYINSGGSGNSGKTSGGFNGGGGRPSHNGGGGASDIRIGSDSLYARVIVAGGGGSDGASNKPGKYGGGSTGGSATESYGSGGGGATQTSGGTGGSNNSGAFGHGGAGKNASSGYAGSGGGGWYGGGGSYPDSSGDDDRGGGGGSGYVYTSAAAKNYPSGCLLNETYYLMEAKTIAGNMSFKSPTDTSETGHSGDGFCRITVIEASNLNLFVKIHGEIHKGNDVYIKNNGQWRRVQNIHIKNNNNWISI